MFMGSSCQSCQEILSSPCKPFIDKLKIMQSLKKFQHWTPSLFIPWDHEFSFSVNWQVSRLLWLLWELTHTLCIRFLINVCLVGGQEMSISSRYSRFTPAISTIQEMEKGGRRFRTGPGKRPHLNK
jgi:hypothetical protein